MKYLWRSSRQGCCVVADSRMRDSTHPALGLAGRTTVPPLRLRIPPLFRSWAWDWPEPRWRNKPLRVCHCACTDRNNGAPCGSGGSFKEELLVRRPGGECCWESGPPRRVSSAASSGVLRSLPPFIPSTAWSEAPQMLGLLQTWQRCCNSSTSFSSPPPRYQLRPRGAFTCCSSAAQLLFCSHTPSATIEAKQSAPFLTYSPICHVTSSASAPFFYHFTQFYLN